MELQGHTILITGGGTGIGRALAEALHDAGNTVIIAGRRQAVLDDVVAGRPGIDTVVLDISDPASISASIERVVARHPALDVVINNAGVSATDDPSAPLDDAEITFMVETNLLGGLRVSSALVEHLKTRSDAMIVYNTSTLAFLPIAIRAVYSATKAALHSYALSQRFMLRNTSVRVVEILPPWVNTGAVDAPGFEGAVHVDDFVRDVLVQLREGRDEVVVDAAVASRRNAGPDEHAFVTAHNAQMLEAFGV
jgi:uncharacterized oxidoreductase